MGGQKQQDHTKGTMLSACWALRMGGCRHAFLPALSPWGQRPYGPHGQLERQPWHPACVMSEQPGFNLAK